jgi:hypothetical protein
VFLLKVHPRHLLRDIGGGVFFFLALLSIFEKRKKRVAFSSAGCNRVRKERGEGKRKMKEINIRDVGVFNNLEIEDKNNKSYNGFKLYDISEIYKRICSCRDFEISLVWQRAIFLTAFLLGCFTAYGFVIDLCIHEGHYIFSVYKNIIAFGVTLVGITISCIWIMMAKGSKAWYELYESAIEAFIEKYDNCDEVIKEILKSNWRSLIAKIGNDKNGIHEPARNRFLFTTKGGAYSVSRLNIVIGWVSFIIWVCLGIMHIILLSHFSKCIFVKQIIGFIRSGIENPYVLLGCLLLTVVIRPIV